MELTLLEMGAKGLSTDMHPFALPPEYITAAQNISIRSGAIRSAGGSSLWNTPSSGFNAGHLMEVDISAVPYWLVMGRSAVYAFNGAVWSNISSAAGYAGITTDGELNWTSCMLGKIPVINNPGAHPEYWNPISPTQILQPLQFNASNTWTAMGYSCAIMRSHKNFLFAMDLTEGVNEFPDAYRWSHPADINGLPYTWDETDVSGLASKEALGGDSGRILDGLTLRDSFCIYSENAINILDYTGDEFVFRRRNLSSTISVLHTNCVVEVKGVHYFMAQGDIFRNDGTSIQSIASNRIRNLYNAEFNEDAYQNAYAFVHRVNNEIWFCFPEGTNTYASKALIYNWQDDSWAVRDLPTGVSRIEYGFYVPDVSTLGTWDSLGGFTWNEYTTSWGGNQENTPFNDALVGIAPADSSAYVLEWDNPDSDVTCSIERMSIPLGGHKNVTTVTRVYPHMTGSQTVNIQFGSQDYAGSPVRWKSAVSFNPETDRKIDLRTTGELHCYRITSTGTARWEISGMEIEYVVGGKR